MSRITHLGPRYLRRRAEGIPDKRNKNRDGEFQSSAEVVELKLQGGDRKEIARMNFCCQLLRLAYQFSPYYGPSFDPADETGSSISRNGVTLMADMDTARMQCTAEQQLQDTLDRHPEVDHLSVVEVAEAWNDYAGMFFQAVRALIERWKEKRQRQSDEKHPPDDADVA